MNNYMVGQLIRLTGVFKNASNVAADPDTVACKVRNPAGTITSHSPTKSSTGNYYYDLTIPADGEGEWRYRFEGTGAITAADEDAFFVRDSSFD